MNKLGTKALLAMALLGAGLPGQAQYGPGQYNGGGYAPRGYTPDARSGDPLDQVGRDLDRAGADMYYLSRGEIRRLNHARHEIGEFQGKRMRGRFDRGELNDVIGSLQHVVDKNRLQPRDRDLLFNDLARLREFRARSQYSGYGYR